VHNYGDIYHRTTTQSTPEVTAELDLVVEDLRTDFCGAIVGYDKSGAQQGSVILEDANGTRRLFPMLPAAFLLEGRPVTLVRPKVVASNAPKVSASGSVRVEQRRAKVALPSRIWVEGKHDAELVERIWGHDLRVEGVAVEPLHGVDDIAARVAEFNPSNTRRIGILVDHLVTGSKESRLAAAVDNPHVLITGHPYIDIWQAVKPSALGIKAWPSIPRGMDWKTGICAALNWPEPPMAWQKILRTVSNYRDVEPGLIGAVEHLIDFVTDQPTQPIR
jgi:hypothetical protein